MTTPKMMKHLSTGICGIITHDLGNGMVRFRGTAGAWFTGHIKEFVEPDSADGELEDLLHQARKPTFHRPSRGD